MKKPYILSLLFVCSFAMSSCSESYDVTKPVKGINVSEITIPLNDGSSATITKNTSKEDSLAIFSKLKKLDSNNYNWDAKSDIKTLDEYKTGKLRTSGVYKANAKVRSTNTSDKHGYYKKVESLTFIEENASTSADALQYSGYTISRENNKYIGFFGHVATPETIDGINKNYGRTVLYEDPDLEPGFYYKDGINGFPEAGYDTLGFRGSRYFRNAEMVIPYYDPASLLSTYVVNNHPDLETDFTYKLTKHFLILNIEKPLGLFCFAPPQDLEFLYSRSDEFGCFFKAEVFFDVNDGELAYFKASFRTLNFGPSFRGIPFEGTFVLKTQKESNEGYERYMKIREEVVNNYTTRS